MDSASFVDTIRASSAFQMSVSHIHTCLIDAQIWHCDQTSTVKLALKLIGRLHANCVTWCQCLCRIISPMEADLTNRARCEAEPECPWLPLLLSSTQINRCKTTNGLERAPHSLTDHPEIQNALHHGPPSLRQVGWYVTHFVPALVLLSFWVRRPKGCII